ncbi:MAG: endonuclease NucS [Chloroflexi bacterium]|nr:endonuclease NucS [Chloroflexota bacterium]
MADLGVWTVDGDAPKRVSRSGVGLERNLEDWIANDSSLLADGLTIVGRQVRLEGGPLDLLAIDWQDRWVVIELKRERLYRGALAQALDYASSIAAMDGDELEALLQPGLATLGDAVHLSAAVQRQLNGEEGVREVAVLLAGVGVDTGLERIVAHLGGYGVPISIVSFEAFEPEGGSRLLIREVTEEHTERRAPRPKRTLDDIRLLAADAGVEASFDRLLGMGEKAGLVVRTFPRSINMVHPSNRIRRLIYARPTAGAIGIQIHAPTFVEFFPPLTDDAVSLAVGADTRTIFYEGSELDARLDQIEAFLRTLPRGDDAADEA